MSYNARIRFSDSMQRGLVEILALSSLAPCFPPLTNDKNRSYVDANAISALSVGGYNMGDMRFVADSMLGRLAKWLRALGYDTHYHASYPPEIMDALIGEGRLLLTRHRKRAERSGKTAVFIHGNHVGEQLIGLARELHLTPPPSAWFSRCLLCNAQLGEARENEAREKVPEYIFHQNANQIRFCPSCGRYFWPGSHRSRMVSQLREWGFPVDHNCRATAQKK